jgi:hypothetical protein
MTSVTKKEPVSDFESQKREIEEEGRRSISEYKELQKIQNKINSEANKAMMESNVLKKIFDTQAAIIQNFK